MQGFTIKIKVHYENKKREEIQMSKNAKRYVKHHIKNKSLGGHSSPENLLYIREEKEKLIHHIFGARDFYEIIIFILRIARAKHFEQVNPRIKELYKFLN